MIPTTMDEKAMNLLEDESLKVYLNPDWETLDNKGKRIAIALDAIKSVLLTKQYTPTRGRYTDESYLRRLSELTGTTDVQKLLQLPNIKHCQVCELGACLLSLIRFENKAVINDANWSDLTPIYNQDRSYLKGNPFARERLAAIFGHEMLSLMESAFEGSICISHIDRYVNCIMAIDFGEQYLDSTERFLAININIVMNDGEFKPEILV